MRKHTLKDKRCLMVTDERVSLVIGTAVTISVVEVAAVRRRRSRNEQKAVVKVALLAARVNAH